MRSREECRLSMVLNRTECDALVLNKPFLARKMSVMSTLFSDVVQLAYINA